MGRYNPNERRDPITNRVIRDPAAFAGKVEAAKDEAFELNHKYHSVFDTGAGADVMEDLEAQFGGTSIVPGDPYGTHARAGAQEVLLYIRDRMKVPE